MIPEIPSVNAPEWLNNASAPLLEFPLVGALANSVYYPSCAFDGQPVKFLAGNFHSFIYVDYGVDRAESLRRADGFRGYHPLAFRDVTPSELTPHGWSLLPLDEHDGDPQKYRDWIHSPFAVWTIYERTHDFGPEHGPLRFSLLYIGGDGAATFQALYQNNRIFPDAIVIIQPGHGFGGNWTNYEDRKQILARSVLENRFGKPKYLLYGGWGNADSYLNPCWPDYSVPVRRLTATLRLWKRHE